MMHRIRTKKATVERKRPTLDDFQRLGRDIRTYESSLFSTIDCSLSVVGTSRSAPLLYAWWQLLRVCLDFEMACDAHYPNVMAGIRFFALGNIRYVRGRRYQRDDWPDFFASLERTQIVLGAVLARAETLFSENACRPLRRSLDRLNAMGRQMEADFFAGRIGRQQQRRRRAA